MKKAKKVVALKRVRRERIGMCWGCTQSKVGVQHVQVRVVRCFARKVIDVDLCPACLRDPDIRVVHSSVPKTATQPLRLKGNR